MLKDGHNRRRWGVMERQPDPTPIQISTECAVIRMAWSERERRARWQMSEWRRQAAHCPPDLLRMLSELD